MIYFYDVTYKPMRAALQNVDKPYSRIYAFVDFISS